MHLLSSKSFEGGPKKLSANRLLNIIIEHCKDHLSYHTQKKILNKIMAFLQPIRELRSQEVIYPEILMKTYPVFGYWRKSCQAPKMLVKIIQLKLLTNCYRLNAGQH